MAGVAPDAASTEPRVSPAQRWVLVATSLAMGLAFVDAAMYVTAGLALAAAAVSFALLDRQAPTHPA